MSVSVTMTIKAASGKFEELKEKLSANLVATRGFSGCEMVSLAAPREESNVLLLLERWKQLGDFHSYKAWRIRSKTSVLSGDLVAEPPTVIIADVLF